VFHDTNYQPQFHVGLILVSVLGSRDIPAQAFNGKMSWNDNLINQQSDNLA